MTGRCRTGFHPVHSLAARVKNPCYMAQPSSSFPISSAGVTAIFVAIAIVAMTLLLGDAWPIATWTLVVNGVILIVWLTSAIGLGSIVLRMIRVECAMALQLAIAAAMGLGLISLLTLGLGCAGGLNRATGWGELVPGIVAAIVTLKTQVAWRRALPKKLERLDWLWLAMAPMLGIAIACALLPPGVLWGDEPNGYDVTEYHLQVPREWFEASKIIPLRHNVFSYFPFNVEMHSLLAMHLRGGPWNGMYLAQLMHANFIALTVFAIYALLVEKHPRGAIIASVFAGATPWMTLLAPMAYNEGGLLLFGTLAIGLAMQAIDAGGASAHPSESGDVLKQTRRMAALKWMILSGAMTGFACGSKLTAVPGLLIPLPLIVVVAQLLLPPLPLGEGWGEGLISSRRVSPSATQTFALSTKQKVQHAIILLATFFLGAAIVFCPWLIRNTIWARNPVFPELTHIFGRAHWTDTQVQRWTQANHLPRPDQQNFPGRLHAGWNQVLNDWRFGYLLLPIAGCALALRRDRDSFCLAALLLFNAVFWLFFTHLQSRFFVLAIPICSLLIGGVRGRVWEGFATLAALTVAGMGTFFISDKIASIERRLEPYHVRLFSLIGLPSLRSFSRLPETDDCRTMELIGEGQAFYYDIPMKRLYYRTVFDVDAQPGESARQAWSNGWPVDPNINVIVNESELERFHQTYFGIPNP